MSFARGKPLSLGVAPANVKGNIGAEIAYVGDALKNAYGSDLASCSVSGSSTSSNGRTTFDLQLADSSKAYQAVVQRRDNAPNYELVSFIPVSLASSSGNFGFSVGGQRGVSSGTGQKTATTTQSSSQFSSPSYGNSFFDSHFGRTLLSPVKPFDYFINPGFSVNSWNANPIGYFQIVPRSAIGAATTSTTSGGAQSSATTSVRAAQTTSSSTTSGGSSTSATSSGTSSSGPKLIL
jgi:hypothetical protein